VLASLGSQESLIAKAFERALDTGLRSTEELKSKTLLSVASDFPLLLIARQLPYKDSYTLRRPNSDASGYVKTRLFARSFTLCARYWTCLDIIRRGHTVITRFFVL